MTAKLAKPIKIGRMYDRISFFFGKPIKTLGSLGKIRVGRVTGNTHIFFFGLTASEEMSFENVDRRRTDDGYLHIL